MTMAGYVFSKLGDTLHAAVLGYLADMLDEHTKGVLGWRMRREGMRFLEIGAGASTVPAWAAESAHAEVLAVDLEPDNVPPADGVSVTRLDVATDPIPSGWDVIHARVVLTHLPNRVEVLRALAGALNPDGVLIVEEFAAHWAPHVLRSPDPDAQRLLDDYHAALATVMRIAGTAVDTWADSLPLEMHNAGLINVEASYHSRTWCGGTPGCMLPFTMLEHRHDQLVAAGFPEADIARLRDLLLDPRLVIAARPLMTVVGEHR